MRLQLKLRVFALHIVAVLVAALGFGALQQPESANAFAHSEYLPPGKYVEHRFANHGLFYFGLRSPQLTVSLIGTAVARDGRIAVVGLKIPEYNDTDACDSDSKQARNRVPFVIMLNADGSRDERFGARGYRANLGIHTPGQIQYQNEQPAFDSTGRLVVAVAGLAGTRTTLIRLLPNGHRDSSFANRGRLVEPGSLSGLTVGPGDSINYLQTVQGKPDYDAPAVCFPPPSREQFSSIVALNSDGIRNSNFADDGQMAIPRTTPITGARTVSFSKFKRMSDGRFVLFGTAHFLAADAPSTVDLPHKVTTPGYSMPVIARVSSEGAIDSSFGNDGFVLPTDPHIPAVEFVDAQNSVTVANSGAIFALLIRYAPISDAHSGDRWIEQLLRVNSDGTPAGASGGWGTTLLDSPRGRVNRMFNWGLAHTDSSNRALMTRVSEDDKGEIAAGWLSSDQANKPHLKRWAARSGYYDPVSMTSVGGRSVLIGSNDFYGVDGKRYSVSNITLFKARVPAP